MIKNLFPPVLVKSNQTEPKHSQTLTKEKVLLKNVGSDSTIEILLNHRLG